MAVGPVEGLKSAPPVLGKRLALPGKHRNACEIVDRSVGTDCDRSRGVILSREDVAARPADFRTEVDQGLDEHRGLNRHVEGTGDPSALEWRLALVLLAKRHQPGHLVLCKLNFLTTVGDGLRREVCNFEVETRRKERKIGVEKGSGV